MLPPADNHDWLSLHDEEGTTWLFDLSYFTSSYRCIYGMGCPSIEPEPDLTGTVGCCSHGAHFVDADDRAKVEARVAQMEPGEWQLAGRAKARGGPFKQHQGGDWMTRTTNGACIFLNREGFDGGAGCALHAAALRRGERPIDWKPSVCWQVPIRLDVHEDDYGHQTVLVRAWQRRDWGPGGDEFHWWCIEEEEAYSAPAPLWVSAREELVELVGEDIYERLAAELASRRPELHHVSGPNGAAANVRRRATPVTVGSKRRT
ncbi:MAG: hypothetical protein OEY41_04690 [Acidimicrobiia bacterium]|nr:hypothetical protein [Acidimicrobiia bacterium]MDH5289278.1 hypothetical protein [Acidimicrobiia bacterium]